MEGIVVGTDVGVTSRSVTGTQLEVVEPLLGRLHEGLIRHTPTQRGRGEVTPTVVRTKLRGGIATDRERSQVFAFIIVIRTGEETKHRHHILIAAGVTDVGRGTVAQCPGIGIILEDVTDTGALHVTADTPFDRLRTDHHVDVMHLVDGSRIGGRIGPLPTQVPVAGLSQSIVVGGLLVGHVLTLGHRQTPHTHQTGTELRAQLQPLDPGIAQLRKEGSLAMEHAVPIVLRHRYLMGC